MYYPFKATKNELKRKWCKRTLEPISLANLKIKSILNDWYSWSQLLCKSKTKAISKYNVRNGLGHVSIQTLLINIKVQILPWITDEVCFTAKYSSSSTCIISSGLFSVISYNVFQEDRPQDFNLQNIVIHREKPRVFRRSHLHYLGQKKKKNKGWETSQSIGKPTDQKLSRQKLSFSCDRGKQYLIESCCSNADTP